MSQPPPWPPQPGGRGPQFPPYSPYPSQYPPQPLRSVSSGLILALGIMGLLICGVFGPFAAVMGGNAVAAIDRGEADPSERGSANTGRILGIIGSVFLVLSVLLVLVGVASPSFRQGFAQGFEKSYHGGSSGGSSSQ